MKPFNWYVIGVAETRSPKTDKHALLIIDEATLRAGESIHNRKNINGEELKFGPDFYKIFSNMNHGAGLAFEFDIPVEQAKEYLQSIGLEETSLDMAWDLLTTAPKNKHNFPPKLTPTRLPSSTLPSSDSFNEVKK